MDSHYKNALLEGDFQCFIYDTSPIDVSLHEHDFCELLLFLSGDVTYHLDGESFLLQPGQLVLVNSHTLHQPYFQSAASYRRVVLWVRKTFLYQVSTPATNLLRCFEQNSLPVVQLPEKDQKLFEALALTATCPGTTYGSDVETHCAVLQMLLLANRTCAAGLGGAQANSGGRFGAAISHMHQNFRQPLSLETLAASCYVSKYHFTREFKREYGISACAYLAKLRLAKAKRLITQRLPIQEAALQCGYRDYNAFLKAFKQEYGATPTQFLQLMQ